MSGSVPGAFAPTPVPLARLRRARRRRIADDGTLAGDSNRRDSGPAARSPDIAKPRPLGERHLTGVDSGGSVLRAFGGSTNSDVRQTPARGQCLQHGVESYSRVNPSDDGQSV